MRVEELLGSPLRLRHLYVAVAIADGGSVSAASERLHLTAPAVSRSLRELEDALGVKLFERSARGMALSDEGEALIPHVRLIVTEVGALSRHAGELRTGDGGEVRVGTVLAGSARLLPDAVLAVTEQYPDVRVRIVESTPVALHESLLAGDVDLVVGRTTPIASLPGVAVEVLHDDAVAVVARADHDAVGAGGLADLVDAGWVLPPAETSLRQQVDAAFEREAGRRPQNLVECVAPMPVRRMVLHGGRLAVVPAGVFADDIERGELVRLPVDIAGTAVPIGIITRDGGTLPLSARRLIDALRRTSAAIR